MNRCEELFYNTFIGMMKTDKSKQMLRSGERIGPYYADFILRPCFVIEIDGPNHNSKENKRKDYKRERYLMKRGYLIIRFTNEEVLEDPKRCIKEMVDTAHDFLDLNRKIKYFYYTNQEII